MSRKLSDEEILLLSEIQDLYKENPYSSDESEESDHLSINSYDSDIKNEEDLPISNEELSFELNNTHPSAKDQSVWYYSPQYSGKTPAHNIIKCSTNKVILTPGITIEDSLDAFRLLFTDNLLSAITDMTNKEAVRVHAEKKYKKQWNVVDNIEMCAFIGVLLTAGYLKSSDVSIDRLWSKKYGPPIFRATLSKNRYHEILRFLRFDDKSTRIKRRAKDKLAPIRDFWEEINCNLGKYYMPSSSITVGEQLIGFDGKCPFKQYMSSKPEKYGMKIFWANDGETGFPLGGIPYLGKEGNQCAINLGEEIVKKLCKPYFHTNRNITCGNFFTTKQLALDLRSSGLTMIGTLRKNKTFIPKNFQANRSREEFSTIFGFTECLTLLSYVPQKGRAVILLSTMHHDNMIVEDTKRKPEIIIDYNKTKGGTDLMDKMVKSYTCKRKTNRWPLAFFMNLLDVTVLAAYLIYTNIYPNWNIGKNERINTFLEDISEALISPHLQRRYQKNLRNEMLKHTISSVTNESIDSSTLPPLAKKQRKQCYLCETKRKVFQNCVRCNKNTCNSHCKMVCEKCFK